MSAITIAPITTPDPRADETLADGTSGAIMVLGLFMAMFLVGALYFVIGIGETIIFRERMQDAADAAAFSAAVMDARGMNLIALINIIMAGLLAILVALQAVQLLCLIAIGIATGAAFFTGGASLGAIPILNTIRSTAQSIQRSLRDPIMELLRVGHTAEGAISQGMPLVAEGKAIILTMEAYRPPATVGFVWPVATPLPTESAPFSWLCDRAATYVANLLEIPFGPVLGIPVVGSFIRGAFGAIADASAAIVCGGSVSVPALPGDYSKPRPLSAAGQQCVDVGTQASCDQAQIDERNRQVDSNGGCTAATNPAECQHRLNDAVSACQPGGSAHLFHYEWQEATYVTVVHLDPMTGHAVADPPIIDTDHSPNPYHMGPSDTPPCGTGGSVATTYGSAGNICQEDISTRVADIQASLESGALVGPQRVPGRRVLNIDGCKERGTQPTPDLGSSVSGSDDRAPYRVRDGLHMGDEAFQLRGFVLGGMDFDREDHMVRAANSFRDDGGGSSRLFQTMRNLGRISTAQAEFYFDGTDDSKEWLFNMAWRARLRRFRMPSSMSSGGSLTDACNSSNSDSGGAGCSGTSGLDLSFLERVIIH